MRMIAYMIIAILLIQTCHCGSSNNSVPCHFLILQTADEKNNGLTEKIVKMLRPDGELFNNIHHRVTIQFLFNFEYYIGVYGQVLSKYSIKLIQ
ncbi:hypothetical protein KSF78_0008978 [Schistosoma japonicum]|nr:hypothetical protein KSF78_0008978 [Schistosoma japonicum]